MKRSPYLLRGLLDVLLLLPLLFQLSVMVGGMAAGASGNEVLGWCIVMGAGAAFVTVCVWSGRRLIKTRGEDADLSASSRGFFLRYQPIVVACAYTLIVALIALFRPVPDERAVFGPFVAVFGMAHLSSSMIMMVVNLVSVPSPWYYLTPPLAIYAFYAAGMAWAHRELQKPRTFLTGRAVAFALFILTFGLISWRAQTIRGSVWLADRRQAFAEGTVTERYRPLSKDNLLVKIATPGLEITGDYPRLDGATAAFPIYAAAAEAMYKEIDETDMRGLVDSSTTPDAYKKLISGEVDVIFAAQPSPEQRADAETAGMPLTLTPIAREAFVFFINKDNPVNGLTTGQIRGIYTKTIRNWSEVGGENRRIVAFQRPEGSGSQTALERKVMRGEKLPAPPREEYAESMGGIMQRVASYQNSREAIGYSFRYFTTTMNAQKDIKLLAIDGIMPTRETIRAGTYPYTVDVYAITAGTRNPHAGKLITWFLTPAGQKLVDDTGYVSLGR